MSHSGRNQHQAASLEPSIGGAGGCVGGGVGERVGFGVGAGTYFCTKSFIVSNTGITMCCTSFCTKSFIVSNRADGELPRQNELRAIIVGADPALAVHTHFCTIGVAVGDAVGVAVGGAVGVAVGDAVGGGAFGSLPPQSSSAMIHAMFDEEAFIFLATNLT